MKQQSCLNQLYNLNLQIMNIIKYKKAFLFFSASYLDFNRANGVFSSFFQCSLYFIIMLLYSFNSIYSILLFRYTIHFFIINSLVSYFLSSVSFSTLSLFVTPSFSSIFFFVMRNEYSDTCNFLLLVCLLISLFSL